MHIKTNIVFGRGGGGRQRRQHVYVKSDTLAYTAHGIFAKILVSNYWGEADTPPPPLQEYGIRNNLHDSLPSVVLQVK
jgi:hypothetical protein